MKLFRLNRQAIELLQDGQYSEASALFREALSQLLSQMIEETQGLRLEDNIKFRPVLVRESTGPSSEKLHYQDGNAFSLYDRAFLFDAVADAEATLLTTEKYQNIMSAILLYNLGLTYHLMGMQNLTSLDTNLKKALKLYTMILDIADKCQDDDVSNIFFLAAWNNMGHVHSQFCDEREVQRCLECLRSVLAVIDDHDEAWDEDYSYFQMNVLFLHGQDSVATAA